MNPSVTSLTTSLITGQGNSLVLFYNSESQLLCVDLIDKNGLHGNEIVRMVLDEKTLLSHAEEALAPSPKIPKRLTFNFIRGYAAGFGVIVERNGREIEYWKRGEDHTVGVADSVHEAWYDLNAHFFKN